MEGVKDGFGFAPTKVSRLRCCHKETRDTQACVMGFHSEPMTHKCVSWVYDETVRLSSDCLSVMFMHPT